MAGRKGGWNRQIAITNTEPLLANPVDTIEATDVLAVLRPLWQAKPSIAVKVRGRIESVLDAAIVLGHRKDNPARWKGGLALVLPPPKRLVRGHHAALPYPAGSGLRGDPARAFRGLGTTA
jgi:hypothetical protein